MQCAIDPNTSDCNLGVAAVQQMDSVFSMAPSGIQSMFQSAHDSIMSQLNANYSWYDSWIPFNPVCSTVCAIGTQAEQLMQQIQSAMGQSPTPSANPGGIDFNGIIKMVVIGGAIYLGAVYFASHR